MGKRFPKFSSISIEFVYSLIQPSYAMSIRGRIESPFWLSLPCILGVVFGIVIPGSSYISRVEERIASSILGWTYFFAWSLSFYPQMVLNFQRRSVEGLSVDFQVLNLVGFGCYSVYNCMLYFSCYIRSEYSRSHDGHPPAVHINDVAFSLHALVITVIVFTQRTVYGSIRHSVSALTSSFCIISICVAGVWAVALLLMPDAAFFIQFDWLTWVYFLSYIKLAITLVKYVPQVYMNYIRRSTEGFSVWNVVLDAQGGVLSITQLLLDCIVIHHLSSITGNPVKLGLGAISLLFDGTLMFQHWFLYTEHEPAQSRDEDEAQAFFTVTS